MTPKPKVLVLDIETSLMEAWVFNTRDQYISHSQIKTDWHVMAWAAKWLGAPAKDVIYADQRNVKNKTNDKIILTKLLKLLNQADYLLTQNGRKFDLPKLKARFMLNGLQPPKFLKHIDMYRELKGIGFTSHSLDYLTAKLCKKYRKLSHKNFPGMSLWIECIQDNPKAWAEMKTYNIYDVLSTEELFHNTKKWLPKVVYELGHPVSVCSTCGRATLGSNGIRLKNGITYRRLFCKHCGTWQRGEVGK